MPPDDFTMIEPIRLLDSVALTDDIPEFGLVRGQVGAVVLEHSPGVFEVEFCDDHGRTYAVAALQAEQLLPLRYAPGQAA